MHINELDYPYPEDLIATEPQWPCRVLLGPSAEKSEPEEISFSDLLNQFHPGDLLVINDTRVEARRIFTDAGLEILFLNPMGPDTWHVLFPAKSVKDGEAMALPGGVTAHLVSRGLPQTLKLSQSLTADYFQAHGEVALPPYIQKARGARHNRDEDDHWYQTEWARENGSVASPTASLHFRLQDLDTLKARGVEIATVTLHVGIGTFLPIRADDITEHKMHHEEVHVPADTVTALERTKARGGHVWALGTTVTRTLESLAGGRLQALSDGAFGGRTDLFIRPGYEWKMVDRLLTNFHQPKTTLIAMVAAFAGDLEKLKHSYAWAIERKFRLFSYGDLTVWRR